MKTRILTLVAAALLAGFTLRAANDGEDSVVNSAPVITETFKATVNQYHNDIVEFRVEKPDHDVVWLKVLDDKGLILYAKRMKKANSAEIDVKTSKLPEGKYDYVVIRNGKEVLRKTVAR